MFNRDSPQPQLFTAIKFDLYKYNLNPTFLTKDSAHQVEDLPCRLNIPGVVPSYRDAVVGPSPHTPSSPLATPLLPADNGVGDKPANGPDNLDTQVSAPPPSLLTLIRSQIVPVSC